MLLKDVCRYIRSKNAGPFWITVDLFFRSDEEFLAYSEPMLAMRDVLAVRLGAAPETLKVFRLPDLLVMKISYPRRVPQGGAGERDMHGGQQYVALLDMALPARPEPEARCSA